MGIRLPDAQLGAPGAGWDAWRRGQCEPGSYMKVSTDWDGFAGSVLWYIRDPDGGIGTIRSHTVTEHEDGTITVAPSIVAPGGYHGWLEHGVWRRA